MSIEFTCSCGKHYKLIKQYRLMMVATGVSEERVDQLMTDLLADEEEEGLAFVDGGEPGESSVATVHAPQTIPARTAPSRNGSYEKTATAAAKTKPAPSAAALERLNGMNPRYLVALGVLVLMAGAYFSWAFFGGPATAATLEARARAAAKAEDRLAAATELSMRKNKEAFVSLRRLATDSNDPEVMAAALIGLTNGAAREDLPLYLGYLEHPHQNVRDAAGNGLFKFFGQPLPGGLKFRANAPPEERAEVKRQLEEMQAASRALAQGPPP